ncbi:MAG: hypothetical protein IMX02_06680 [Limnochordaceae bacterium]|nr:hypothetical protein [Limnochordaceae bacterium]
MPEIVAAALIRRQGPEPPCERWAREYVADYAHVSPQQSARAVLRVLHEVEQVLALILDTAAALARKAQSGAA